MSMLMGSAVVIVFLIGLSSEQVIGPMDRRDA